MEFLAGVAITILFVAGIAFFISPRQLVCCLIAYMVSVFYILIGYRILHSYFGGKLNGDMATISLLVVALSSLFIFAIVWMLAGWRLPEKQPFTIAPSTRRILAVTAVSVSVLALLYLTG